MDPIFIELMSRKVSKPMTIQPGQNEAQLFLDHLVSQTRSEYRPLIHGIAQYHRTHGYVSERQARAVEIATQKARPQVSGKLVVRNAQGHPAASEVAQ